MGARLDMPESEYRAMPGLSGTEVAKILDNPADLKWERDHPTPSTGAQSLGTLVHAMVLGTSAGVLGVMSRDLRTNYAKAWKAGIEATGGTVVKVDQYREAIAARDAVLANADARALLTAPGHSEVTVTGEHRGAPLKGRIDRLPDVGPLVDLKTGKDVTRRGMERAFFDYGYATQLRHYARLIGREEQAPYIVAVRNAGRPAVAVYQIDTYTWDLAGRAVTEAWNRYADCIEADDWPDTAADGITPIGLTPWARDALEARINGTTAADTIAALEYLIGEQA